MLSNVLGSDALTSFTGISIYNMMAALGILPGPVTLHSAVTPVLVTTGLVVTEMIRLQMLMLARPPPRTKSKLADRPWVGDDGSNPDLDVQWGPNTWEVIYTYKPSVRLSRLTQAVWEINDQFALTMGLRYAKDELQRRICSATRKAIWAG